MNSEMTEERITAETENEAAETEPAAVDPEKINDLSEEFAPDASGEEGYFTEEPEAASIGRNAVRNLHIKAAAMRSKPKEVIHEQIGTSAVNDVHAVNDAGDIESEDFNYRYLRQCVRSREILYGIMAGCEFISMKTENIATGEKNEGRLVMSVYLPKMPEIQLIIREEEFWTEGTAFGARYDGMRIREKIHRRQNYALQMMFARIPLILTSVRREKDPNAGSGQTPYIVYAEASRRQAMDLLMRTWFFNPHPNAPKVDAAGVYKANVLQVTSDAVRVECCGVESWIPAWDVTSTAVIENCTEYVENGAQIMVKPRRIVIHHKGDPVLGDGKKETGRFYERDTVTFKVSGALYDGRFDAKALSSVHVNGTYAGTVRRYNRAEDKNVYTVVLLNGVTAAVHAGAVEGGYLLSTGDQVMVTVTEIMDRYVRGRARLCGRRTAGRRF